MEKPLELNMMMIRKRMSVLVFLTSAFLSTWTTLGDTAEIPKGQRLDIGYAPVTGNRIPLWVAQDMGFFARQILATRLVYLASSSSETNPKLKKLNIAEVVDNSLIEGIQKDVRK